MTAFRYEPLGPELFPVGQGPFRARGLAYVTALKYIDARFPGGRAGFLSALGPGDPWAPYFSELFLVSGDYDASPLLRLYVACAAFVGDDVGRFIVERARRSAVADAQGMYKPMLHADTPEGMAERLHLAFKRYFPPCGAITISVAPGRFEGELSKLPEPMAGMHTSSTIGFVAGALDLTGAEEIHVEITSATPEGEISGVPILTARFVATWRSAGARPDQRG